MSLLRTHTLRPLRVGALCRGRVTYAPYSVVEGPVAGAETLGRMQGCASGGVPNVAEGGKVLLRLPVLVEMLLFSLFLFLFL